jgi:hypothetical protein
MADISCRTRLPVSPREFLKERAAPFRKVVANQIKPLRNYFDNVKNSEQIQAAQPAATPVISAHMGISYR